MSNTNNTLQTQTLSSLHNAIMEAGGKDRPPMLAPGNYVQWKYRIKRYIDTKPNHELIYYCVEHPPYKFKWAERTILVVEGSSETMTEGYMENYKNVPEDIRNLLQAEAEVVHIILIRIDNDIYCTVDACPKALDMWKVIVRLKQFLTSVTTRMAKLSAKQVDWRDDTHDEPDNQELEAHYMFMAKIQEVTLDDADNSGPIFDVEPLQKLVEISYSY
ncbi:hypothetical protein Tco_1555458 [Tanacetum coccineum]